MISASIRPCRRSLGAFPASARDGIVRAATAVGDGILI